MRASFFVSDDDAGGAVPSAAPENAAGDLLDDEEAAHVADHRGDLPCDVLERCDGARARAIEYRTFDPASDVANRVELVSAFGDHLDEIIDSQGWVPEYGLVEVRVEIVM